MTMNPSPPSFDTAMRGYERTAVDAKVAALAAERTAFERRAAELEREIAKMNTAMGRGPAADAPYYVTVSRKVESILREADEDARRMTTEATAAGQRDREMAQAAADAMRARMAEEAGNAEKAAQEARSQIIGQSQHEAQTIHSQGVEKAVRIAGGAGEVVEAARAQHAQIAVDTETRLNAQREQFEREVLNRQETAERRLQETAQLAAQMKAESAQMTEDSQRAAHALIEASRAAARELVEETAERAARLQQEAEREVAALTHRRDSINAQLSTVRETLASLSGSAALAAMTRANGK
jgi:cell division septum initiation protein DivIVA